MRGKAKGNCTGTVKAENSSVNLATVGVRQRKAGSGRGPSNTYHGKGQSANERKDYIHDCKRKERGYACYHLRV